MGTGTPLEILTTPVNSQKLRDELSALVLVGYLDHGLAQALIDRRDWKSAAAIIARSRKDGAYPEDKRGG